MRFDERRKRWVRFVEHLWHPDAEAAAYQLATAAVRERYHNADRIQNLADRAAEAKWAIGSESRKRLTARLLNHAPPPRLPALGRAELSFVSTDVTSRRPTSAATSFGMLERCCSSMVENGML